VAGSNKRLTLVATILGSSIAILDSSVVSVALPSIQRSLLTSLLCALAPTIGLSSHFALSRASPEPC
jgi:hypothetical protein